MPGMWLLGGQLNEPRLEIPEFLLYLLTKSIWPHCGIAVWVGCPWNPQLELWPRLSREILWFLEDLLWKGQTYSRHVRSMLLRLRLQKLIGWWWWWWPWWSFCCWWILCQDKIVYQAKLILEGILPSSISIPCCSLTKLARPHAKESPYLLFCPSTF